MRNKQNFAALLKPGWYDLDLDEVEILFVDPFPKSKTRADILKGLKRFLDELQKTSLPWEVWINGSYVTHKVDPEDVDVVCLCQLEGEITDGKNQNIIRYLFKRGQSKRRFKVDAYVVLDFPNIAQREYWADQFGTNDEGVPKGLGRMWVNTSE